MKLNSVYHIAIIVSDIEAAREFYINKISYVLKSFGRNTEQSVITGN